MSLFNSKEIKRLREENEELKTKFHYMYEKENRAKNLEEVLKKLKTEVNSVNEERKSLLTTLENIKNDYGRKKEEIKELNNKVTDLTQVKDELQNAIISYSSQIEDIENAIREKGENTEWSSREREFEAYNYEPDKESTEDRDELIAEIEELRRRIENLRSEEDELNERSELKKLEISEIETRGLRMIDMQDNSREELIKFEQKKEEAEHELKSIKKAIFEKKEILAKYERDIEMLTASKKERAEKIDAEIAELNQMLSIIKEEQQDAAAILSRIKEEEELKIKNIHILEQEASEKEEQRLSLDLRLTELNNSIEIKQNLLEDLKNEYEKIRLELSEKEKELFSIEQTLSVKSNKLSLLNFELLELENKNNTAQHDLQSYEELKDILEKKIIEEKDEFDKLHAENEKMLELIPLLKQRIEELQQGNKELEQKHLEMIKTYSSELNEINKRRNILEEVIRKKEKTSEDKDKEIEQKQSILDEKERLLALKQAEIEAAELMAANIMTQNEELKRIAESADNSRSDIEEEISNIKLETELLLKKKSSIEKTIQEMLQMLNESFSRARDKKEKLDEEMRRAEIKIAEYREKISELINEYTNIKNDISEANLQAGMEKDELKKLNSVKKKIKEEIENHKNILQRYQQIREKLKLQQNIAGTQPDDKRNEKVVGSESSVGIKNLNIFKL